VRLTRKVLVERELESSSRGVDCFEKGPLWKRVVFREKMESLGPGGPGGAGARTVFNVPKGGAVGRSATSAKRWEALVQLEKIWKLFKDLFVIHSTYKDLMSNYIKALISGRCCR
jgi:hypothetical protein